MAIFADMRGLKAIRDEKLTFGSLLNEVQFVFEEIKDERRKNSKFKLKDVLSAGFAIFSLKSASLLEFDKRGKTEGINLKKIYQIEDICSDSHMRRVLDIIDPIALRKGFEKYYSVLKECKIDTDYEYLSGKKILSIDGVSHFSSKQVHCSNCLTKEHKSGEITYSHQMLSAAMVHPDKKEVFPIACEPIINKDGKNKNDCEQNAAKRLIAYLKKNYPNDNFLVVEDALYGNGPHIKELLGANLSFIVGVKPAGNSSLFGSFKTRKERGLLKEVTYKEYGETCQISYCNNLPINSSHSDIRVNMLICEKTDKKGKKTTFSWVTDIKITEKNAHKIMKAGRARWKIENETFNTLKNQGYHFSHNFGHGNKHLSTVLAYLMFFAFFMDQLRQYGEVNFINVWKALGTKSKLWKSIRAGFEMMPFESMEKILEHIAQEFDIPLKNSA